MNTKTKILEIEAGLVKLDSDLNFTLSRLDSANSGLAAAFEIGNANSIDSARENVNAIIYDVECLCKSKRVLRSKLPALRALYTSEW